MKRTGLSILAAAALALAEHAPAAAQGVQAAVPQNQGQSPVQSAFTPLPPVRPVIQTSTVQAGTMQVHTIQPVGATQALQPLVVETTVNCENCNPSGVGMPVEPGIAGTANPQNGAPWEVSVFCGTPPIVPGGIVPAGDVPSTIGYTPYGPPSIGTWGIGTGEVGPNGVPVSPCGPVFAPNWYANVDAMMLLRDQTSDVALVSRGVSDRNVILSTRNFQTDLESGLRVLLGGQLSDTMSLEGLYFGMNHFTDQQAVRNTTPNVLGGTGNLFSPFAGFGLSATPGLDFNNFASINFSSDIHNAEINFRHRMALPPGRLFGSFLMGARFLQVNEGFEYLTIADRPLPAGATNQVTVNTGNDFYGMQLGTQFSYRVYPQWWLNFEVKGALCQNDSQQATSYTNVNSAGVTSQFDGFRNRHTTAFIGDLDLSTGFDILSGLALRLGYKAMWVDGVAVASENFENDINILRLGPAEINHGTLIFHGPYAGIVATW